MYYLTKDYIIAVLPSSQIKYIIFVLTLGN